MEKIAQFRWTYSFDSSGEEKKIRLVAMKSSVGQIDIFYDWINSSAFSLL